jgi:hypothetical protein
LRAIDSAYVSRVVLKEVTRRVEWWGGTALIEAYRWTYEYIWQDGLVRGRGGAVQPETNDLITKSEWRTNKANTVHNQKKETAVIIKKTIIIKIIIIIRSGV